MRLMSERLLLIDGDFIHIMPASSGKKIEGDGKLTTVSFSHVVGCEVSRKHPTHFKVSKVAVQSRHLRTARNINKSNQLVVFKSAESKRYDFVTSSPEYAADIVQEVKKRIPQYGGG